MPYIRVSYPRGGNGKLLHHTFNWCLVLLFGLNFSFGHEKHRSGIVSTFVELRGLEEAEASRGYPARIEGILLFFYAPWEICWVSDGEHEYFISSNSFSPGLKDGDLVIVEGVTYWNESIPDLSQVKVTSLKTGDLPEAIPLEYSIDMGSHQISGYRSLLGTIWDIEEVAADLQRLAFRHGGRLIQVFVKDSKETLSKAAVVGAEVEITGFLVHDPAWPQNANASPVQLFVADPSLISVLRTPPVDPFLLPAIDFGNGNKQLSEALSDNYIRVQGVVDKVISTDQSIVRVGDVVFQVSWKDTTQLNTNDFVDLVGFVEVSDSKGVVVTRAILNELSSNSKKEPESPSIKREFFDLTDLSIGNSPVGHPFEFSAEVVHMGINGVFVARIQDKLTFVTPDFDNKGLSPGDRVKISGRSGSSGSLRNLYGCQVELIEPGTRDQLDPMEFDGLSSLPINASILKLEGMVQSITETPRYIRVNLLVGGEVIHVFFDQPEPGGLLPYSWIGHRISVEGVFRPLTDFSKRATYAHFYAGDSTKITFIDSYHEDRFFLEASPIADLTALWKNPNSYSFKKVSGQVTHVSSNHMVGLQDSSGGNFFKFSSDDLPELGQWIEIICLPSRKSVKSDPDIFGLSWRLIPESPLELTTTSILESHMLDTANQGKWVQVEALVLANFSDSPIPQVVLQSGDSVFKASLSGFKNPAQFSGIKPGSFVSLQGAYKIQEDEWGIPRSFRIFPQRETDLLLLKETPYLTFPKVNLIVGFCLCVSVLAAFWALSLRVKVTQQTAKIKRAFEMETNLRESYRELFENAQDIIFTLDPNCGIIDVNRAGENLFGRDRAELKGLPLGSLIDKKDNSNFTEGVRALVSTETLQQIEVSFRGKSRKRVVLEINARKILDKGFQCICRDVTERTQLTYKVNQLQKMEMVGQLAAGVAHDYNNMMTVILGQVELLKLEDRFNESGMEMLIEIERAALRATDLTRQLLAFSRKQVMKETVFELNELTSNLIRMLERLLGDNLELVCSYTDEPTWVRGDAGMLEQVMVNLSVNARDAMEFGGRLRISTQIEAVEGGSVNHSKEAKSGVYLVWEFSDNGVGIPKKFQQKIFEPFFTTKKIGKGTGLGLSTVDGIVSQHGGWIEVTSARGEGTTFKVYLPIAAAPSQETLAKKEELYMPFPEGSGKILLIEDEPSLNRLLFQVLSYYGYEVLSAPNSSEATAIWAKEKDSIKLVFSDMVIPGSDSGFDLCEQFKKDSPNLKFLLSSGYSKGLDKRLKESHLYDGFLPKPFDPRELLELINRVLKGQVDESQPRWRTSVAVSKN